MMIQPVHSLNCCSPTKSYNSQVQQNPVQQSNQANNPSFTSFWDKVFDVLEALASLSKKVK